MPVETRYFRGDLIIVDGGYLRPLYTTQGAVDQLDSHETRLDYLGIGVFRLLADLSEVEITDGDAHAVIPREPSSTPTEDSATWACPETALNTTDRILVKWYACRASGAGRSLGAGTPHVTEQLNATQLDATTWTVYYWTATHVANWITRHYGPTYPHRILNFSWTPYVPPPPPIGDKPLISPPHITEPQISRPLIRFLRLKAKLRMGL